MRVSPPLQMVETGCLRVQVQGAKATRRQSQSAWARRSGSHLQAAKEPARPLAQAGWEEPEHRWAKAAGRPFGLGLMLAPAKDLSLLPQLPPPLRILLHYR